MLTVREPRNTMPELSFFDSAELATLAQISPELLCVMHGDGRFIKVNPAFMMALGYQYCEIPSLSLFELTHPDDRALTEAAFRTDIHNGVIDGLEQHCRCQDGSYHRLRWHAVYQPESDRIYATARDLGERESTPDKTAGRQFQFSQYVLDNASSPVYWIDKQGKNKYVNPAACESLGYSNEEMLELSVYDYDPRISESDWPETYELFISGELSDFESIHRRKDGSEFPVRISLKIFNADGEEYLCAFATDMSERREQERYYLFAQYAFDNGVDGIFISDSEANIIFVNRKGCRSLGYTFDELKSMTVFDINPRLNYEAWEKGIEQARNGIVRSIETTHKRKDGSIIPFEVNFNVLYFEDSEYFCAFARDITERKRAARKSEELHFAIDNSVDGVFLFNRDAEIYYVNDSACRELGYSYDELTSMTIFDIDPEFSRQDMKNFWESGLEGSRITNEHIHRRKDGSICPVEISSCISEYEGSQYACAFVRNIGERKQSTRQMEELRLAVENAADAIYLYNRNAEIYYANQSACETLGYSLEELTSFTLADIDPEFSFDNHDRIWNQTSDRKLTGVERSHRKKDGTIFPVEINAMYSDFDGYEYATAIVRDITERKLAARKNEELRFAVDNAVDAIYLNDRDGNIYYANQSACNLLGYSQEELTCMNIADIDPEFSNDILQTLIEQIEQGVEIPGEPPEIYHKRKDGSTFPVEVVFNSRSFDGTEYFCSFARDITERKAAERQLQQYRFIVENTTEAVYLTTTTGEIHYVNKSACESLGYSHDELINMHISDFDVYLNTKPTADHIKNVINSNHGVFETAHRRKDGTDFPVEVIFNNTSFDGVEYSFAFARDITERKQSLREMEQLRFAIDNAVDSICLLNEDAEIFYANRHACESLGYSYEELTSMTVFDLDPYVTQELWEATWNAGHTGTLEAVESHHKKKDGTIFPVEISISNNLYDGFAYSCTFARDITRRKEVEKQLLFTQFAIDKAGDAIFFTNSNGDILYANETASLQLDYVPSELTRLTIQDINPILNDGDLDGDEFWEALIKGEVSTIETTHKRKDGTVFPVEVNATVMDFNGEKFSCSVVRDISERIQIQNELQKHRENLEVLVRERTAELENAQEELLRKQRLAVLGQLTAVVGHELRNPLGTIRASLYLIRDKSDGHNSDVNRALGRAERNIVRCDKIIDELLDYTRMRPLDLESINLDDWLAGIIGESQIPVEISTNMDLKSNISIEVEPDRLRRCIINALSNACEAIQEHPTGRAGAITISTYMEGKEVVIDIEDNGIGIPEDKLNRIFEPLYSTKGFGVGLGLPIVEQIIKQHEGTVNLTSIDGEGTKMSLRLPLQRQNNIILKDD